MPDVPWSIDKMNESSSITRVPLYRHSRGIILDIFIGQDTRRRDQFLTDAYLWREFL